MLNEKRNRVCLSDRLLVPHDLSQLERETCEDFARELVVSTQFFEQEYLRAWQSSYYFCRHHGYSECDHRELAFYEAAAIISDLSRGEVDYS